MSEALWDASRLFNAAGSTWLIVFARGRIEGLMPAGPPTLLATEFLRILPVLLGGSPVVLSLRPVRGREEVEPCWCSFC